MNNVISGDESIAYKLQTKRNMLSLKMRIRPININNFIAEKLHPITCPARIKRNDEKYFQWDIFGNKYVAKMKQDLILTLFLIIPHFSASETDEF